MKKIIKNAIDSHCEALTCLEKQAKTIEKIAYLFKSTLRSQGKVIFCGNGGSAADSQHLAAEFVGRFRKERTPLPSIALSCNTSIITAIGNDYGFDEIFSKQIEALATTKDTVVGISTSGYSKNVIKAILKAKELGIHTVGFLGKDGGKLKEIVDTPLVIEMDDTARVQEMHILIGHIICEIVEETLFE